MARTQKQTYLPGTEPAEDPNIEAINEGLDAWLSAQADQKQASATTKIRHTTLVTLIAEHGLDRYPYIDAVSGKKKHVVITRDPKLKTTNAPKKKRGREEPGDEVEPKAKKTKAERDAETVEHRKVPRASVEAEIDPFAATRAKMAGKAVETSAGDHAAAAPAESWRKAEGYGDDDEGGELVELPVGKDKAK